jgi:hypothetical protein
MAQTACSGCGAVLVDGAPRCTACGLPADALGARVVTLSEEPESGSSRRALLVFTLGIVAAAVLYLSSGLAGVLIHDIQHPPAPICDGVAMAPHDQCQPFNGTDFSGPSYSYEDEQLHYQVARFLEAAIVVTVSVVSGVLAVVLLFIAGLSLVFGVSVTAADVAGALRRGVRDA